MKKFSKIVLMMIFCISCLALTACSKSDAEKIIGTWETPVDMSKVLLATASESEQEIMKNYYSNMELVLSFKFKDNKVMMSFTDESFDSFKSSYKEATTKMLTDQFGDSLTPSMEAMGYESVDAYVDEMIGEAFELDTMKSEASFAGFFEIADGKLYMYENANAKNENEFFKYEFVSDSELKFTEVNMEFEAAEIFKMPMTLKKK